MYPSLLTIGAFTQHILSGEGLFVGRFAVVRACVLSCVRVLFCFLPLSELLPGSLLFALAYARAGSLLFFFLFPEGLTMFRRSENRRSSARSFGRGANRSYRENKMIMRGGWRL